MRSKIANILLIFSLFFGIFGVAVTNAENIKQISVPASSIASTTNANAAQVSVVKTQAQQISVGQQNTSSSAQATSQPTVSPIIAVPSLVPAAPDLDVKGYILIDANSGAVIAEKNPDTRLPPASLTKLTSLYIIADSLKTGRIRLKDKVMISKKAWRTRGSRMFVKYGAAISVQQLIDGIVIASGNDATVAMAEYISGSEKSFVNRMNKLAASLGMKNTHYEDSNGLPSPNHYSTSYDIAILARNWMYDFPGYYSWFTQKWIIYSGVKQPNRNRLLWRDPSIDGMKTGHTNAAGYCLVASAVRNGARLISVVMGAPSDAARFNDTETLLNYGFRFFETHKLFAAGQLLANQRIWMGKDNNVKLGLAHNFYVTIPVNQYQELKANLLLPKMMEAPFKKGQKCGEVNVTLDGKLIARAPLVVFKDVPRAGFFGRLFDRMILVFY